MCPGNRALTHSRSGSPGNSTIDRKALLVNIHMVPPPRLGSLSPSRPARPVRRRRGGRRKIGGEGGQEMSRDAGELSWKDGRLGGASGLIAAASTGSGEVASGREGYHHVAQRPCWPLRW